MAEESYIQSLFAERLGGRNFGKDTNIYKFEKIKRAKRAAKEKNPEEYSLKKDGFTICASAVSAKILSEKMKQDIEDGKIRGLKGFDGFFYVVQDWLYQKHRAKIISLIKAEKGIGSEKIAEKA
ncbi:MAG: hypothetical protein AAB257_02475, partial [Nitrospinota bacterium]